MQANSIRITQGKDAELQVAAASACKSRGCIGNGIGKGTDLTMHSCAKGIAVPCSCKHGLVASSIAIGSEIRQTTVYCICIAMAVQQGTAHPAAVI